MADSSSSRANLEAILRWCLRKQDEEESTGTTPMDRERQEWLKGALEAMCSAPSETDLMKAALAVLQSHHIPPPGSDIGEDTKNAMLKAFDEVLYFIEDLDHAKDLMKLGGVAVMMSYFNHPNRDLCAKACEVMGTSAQNEEYCQQACQPAIPQLVQLCMSCDDELVKVKSLYAISCIVREFPPGLEVFMENKGMELLLHCLVCEYEKVIIKALFLLRSISNKTVSSYITDDIIRQVVHITMTPPYDDINIRRHSTFCLLSLVRAVPYKFSSHRARLLETLQDRQQSLTDSNHEDELEACWKIVDLFSK
ncbi:uncharacterized protein [Dysidea avara]|uniref:uncharacterized protein n=1 Tax=Dysidea avara TaxID=196820 RepID=UPI00332686A8